jgi:hypothetical protein
VLQEQVPQLDHRHLAVFPHPLDLADQERSTAQAVEVITNQYVLALFVLFGVEERSLT